MRKRGVLSPAIRWRAEVLDGRKLLRVCDQLGLVCPVLETDDRREAAQLLFLRHPRRALERFCVELSPAAAAEYLDTDLNELMRALGGWQRPETGDYRGARRANLWLSPATDGLLRAVAVAHGVSRSDMLRVGAWFLAQALTTEEDRAAWAQRDLSTKGHAPALPVCTSNDGFDWVSQSPTAAALLRPVLRKFANLPRTALPAWLVATAVQSPGKPRGRKPQTPVP